MFKLLILILTVIVILILLRTSRLLLLAIAHILIVDLDGYFRWRLKLSCGQLTLRRLS